jgi:conjugal transfer mating pair stabilization protein TraN
LSPAQISAIDFTKIDFSAFTSQMMNQALSNLPTNISGNYNPIEQNSSNGTAQKAGSSVLPTY